MAEKFCLKWNDFYTNISHSFRDLRNEENLHDVTLVTDDNQQISAHKLILSISSDYFNALFKNIKQPNMVVCLQGLSKEDVNNCLNYMYNGEVQIFQDDLDKFLDIAERLKIKGLVGSSNSTEETYFQKQENFEDAPIAVSEQYTNKNRESQDLQLVENPSSIQFPSNHEYDMKEETAKYIEILEDGNVRCTICGKISNAKRQKERLPNMRYHIETHFEGLSYNCNLCNKTLKNKMQLAQHKKKSCK